jgi:hypothetical protein
MQQKAATITPTQSQSEVPVKPSHIFSAVAALCAVFYALGPSLHAQEATVLRHTGAPQDWSERSIVFSRDGLARHPELLTREPRVLHQAMQRWQAPTWDAMQTIDPLTISAKPLPPHRDWNASLGAGRVAPHMFPLKFSFNPGAPPDCVNDFVVFGMSTTGSSSQANLVAFNNLYVADDGSGLCPGTAPNVLFAYNITTIGGGISTSPIISLDGTQIGFVESISGATPSAVFHVLTWSATDGGTITAPATPTPTAMTTLPFSATHSTTSSPWIDYGNDIVYVGDDAGTMYQITDVFGGTPTLSGSPWPVVLSAASHLSPAVLDSGLGMLMVGSQDGHLYQINTATGAHTAVAIGAGVNSSGIVAPPIVDVTNGTTFTVSANDGSSAVLVELDTASLTQVSKARIGLGAAIPFGGSSTTIHLGQPAFNNNYYNSPTTGSITLCGTSPTNTSPYQYTLGFVGTTMNTLGLATQLSTSTTNRCTGWTEFYNPNADGGLGTDFYFFGLTQDCTQYAAGVTTGCVVALSSNSLIATSAAAVKNGPSGIVVDNYSTAAQASSIYLSAVGASTAYKFTQVSLQ